MKKAAMALALAVAMLVAMPGKIAATRWSQTEVTCPVCGTVNTFFVVASSGGYIYEWPSKYQYIFWPYTEKDVAHSCGKCRLTCFMGDFADVPAEKHEALRRAMAGVTFGGSYKDYSEIPMPARLEAAEKVYAILERDDRFWCHFYRVMGYHYAKEAMQEKAAGARRKALALAQKMLQEQGSEGTARELHLISGAMKRLLKDDAGALRDFRSAARLTYTDTVMEKDAAANKDAWLSDLLALFISEMPRGGGIALIAGGVALACAVAAGARWHVLRRRKLKG